ncbi:MAG: helicase-related protein, partial [Clostridium sp.]
QYFRECKRTRLIVHKNEILEDEFIEWADELIKNNPNKKILFIMNTIKFSQNLFNKLYKLNENREFIYLSTSIVPIKRRKRIDNIKDSKEPLVVISTQMVEAGVDIDVDIVVRDIAPLDSINQSAGRANRENRGEYLGEVHIVKIVKNQKKLAEYVYRDLVQLKATESVLMDCEVILEEDYKSISDKYYKELKSNISNRESKDLIQKIFKLQFEEVESNFNLIENQDKVQLFVEVDEVAKKIWNKYIENLGIKDKKEKRKKMDSIKGEFYNYVISVYKNKCREHKDEFIGYISYNEIESIYDENFGYIVEDDNYKII